ncbi:hypothetical protein L0F63_002183 [Massospora cicadina]|nr:hypothetical protein L0F63_002183 [Massospora cicadina]
MRKKRTCLVEANQAEKGLTLIARSKYLLVMDLASGQMQVEIYLEDEEKMPQGLLDDLKQKLLYGSILPRPSPDVCNLLLSPSTCGDFMDRLP